MAIDLSNVSQTIHELPDLFCQLYDGADGDLFRLRIAAWLTDPKLEDFSAAIERRALAGTLTAESAQIHDSREDDREARRFAILRGLDRTFACLNPSAATGMGCPPALTSLGLFAAARYRLDSGAHGGALIPRANQPPRDGQFPGELRDAFTAVVRVPPESWEACGLRVMPEHALLHRHEISAGLRVACAPLIADPREMTFEAHSRDGGRFYRIRPRNLKATLDRVERVLDTIVASGARIGVAPELVLTADLLDAWRSALDVRRGRTGKLQWLLVGSGDVDGESRPSNAAVLLDGRSGDELARQAKIYPFNFKPEVLRRWGLTEHLGSEPIDEDLRPGRRLTILEGGGARLAILVCEDLKRVADFTGHLRGFGVSHVLAPVFGRPIKNHRWERECANVHAGAAGSTVVVSNSRLMHSILGRDEGTGLVVWPEGALVLRAEDADRIACFTLQPDGSAVLDQVELVPHTARRLGSTRPEAPPSGPATTAKRSRR